MVANVAFTMFAAALFWRKHVCNLLALRKFSVNLFFRPVFEDAISILHNFKNLEIWLENLRIISAPAFIRYKIFIFFSIYVYVCKKKKKYKANKGLVVVVVKVLSLLRTYFGVNWIPR